MDKLLILDFNSIVISSLMVQKNLSFEEIRTGGAYGFINRLVSAIQKLKPTRLLVVNDCPPYWRSVIYPEYKQDRNKFKNSVWDNTDPKMLTISDSIKQNKDYIRRFCDLLQIPIWELKGYEADDLIAFSLTFFLDDFEKIVIESNDSDLYQFLNIVGVTLFKHGEEYTYEIYQKEFSYLPIEYWVQANALSGTHNNVKGIDGIGLKKAAKFLTSTPKDTLEQALKEKGWLEIFERNMEIISLPFMPNPPTIINPPTLTRIKFKERDTIRFLAEWNIAYTQKMEETFSWLASQ